MKASLFAGAFAAVLCLSGPAAAAPAPATLTAIPLPADVSYPEGIAYDPSGQVFYTANAVDGTVAKVDLRTGQGTTLVKSGGLSPLVPGVFPVALGMKVDGRGRLWIAGGSTARVYVVNARTGAVLANMEAKAPGSGTLNDLVVTPTGVYVTDTRRPVLWRINPSPPFQPQAWLDLSSSPIEYGQGANLNGIAATPDGRSLIVGHMSKGLIFHVDTVSKAITPINIGGESLAAADGLVLDGRTLYVVRQAAGEVVAIAMAADFKSGRVQARLQDPRLMFPATAAKAGDRLLVVNTQFNTRQAGNATKPFTVLSVPLSRLNPPG